MNAKTFIDLAPYLLPYFIAFGVSISIGFYAWQRREVNGAKSFSAVVFSTSIYTFFYMCELVSHRLEWKIFWDNFQFIPTFIFPIGLFAFALQYSGLKLKQSKNIWRVIVFLPIAFILLIFTDNFHKLIRPSSKLILGEPFSALEYPFTPVFWFMTMYVYIIVITGLLILIVKFFRSKSVYRTQVLIITMGAAVPLIGTFLTALEINFGFHRDTAPFTFTIFNMIVAWGLLRFRLFDVVHMARDTVIESLNDSVIIIDPSNRVVDFNSSAKERFNIIATVAIGLPVDQVFSKWPDLYNIINMKKSQQDICLVINSNPMILDTSITPIHDQRGTFKGHTIIVRDITQKKYMEEQLETHRNHLEDLVKAATSDLELTNERLLKEIKERIHAEKALMNSESRFRSLFDSNPNSVILSDFEGTILEMNRTFLKMTGYSSEELMNTQITKLTHEKYHDEILQAIKLTKSGIVQDEPLEIEILNKNGSLVPVMIKGWLVTDQESKPVALGSFIKDITKEKMFDAEKTALLKQLQQTQKMEAIGTLAGGIAHDFNNILAGIIGYTELSLLEVQKNEKLTNNLSRVFEAAGRAKELVQQILSFSRRESGSLRKLSLTPVIKEAVHFVRSIFPSTITVMESYQVDLDTIKADETQIHQVITNLCTNSYHAMQETSGTLSILLENTYLESPRKYLTMIAFPGNYAKITIADSGPGIPEDIKERIFEPYFTTKDTGEGTGLGLSVTLGIVKSHNGLIELKSNTGKGAEFTIYLPITSQEELESIDADGAETPGNNEQILVVDDEIFFIDIVAQHLKSLGYQVKSNQSSLRALEIFRKDPTGFDLIISDQIMPEMTGVQFVSEIRKLNLDIPVILCTGYSEVVTEQTAKHYGISKFLMKPITRKALSKAVHYVLQNSRSI